MQVITFRTFSIAASAVALTLLGCSEQSKAPQATYTVDEYLAKPELLAAKLRECANDPGELRNDPDCINVKEAAKRQGVGSYDELPPLKLSKPEASAESEKPSP